MIIADLIIIIARISVGCTLKATFLSLSQNRGTLKRKWNVCPRDSKVAATLHVTTIQWILERAILAIKNSTVDTINNIVVSHCFVGPENVFFSADTATNQNDATRFSVEYLNRLTPTGLPPHRIILTEENHTNTSKEYEPKRRTVQWHKV